MFDAHTSKTLLNVRVDWKWRTENRRQVYKGRKTSHGKDGKQMSWRDHMKSVSV